MPESFIFHWGLSAPTADACDHFFQASVVFPQRTRKGTDFCNVYSGNINANPDTFVIKLSDSYIQSTKCSISCEHLKGRFEGTFTSMKDKIKGKALYFDLTCVTNAKKHLNLGRMM